MKAAPFEYSRPADIDEACAMLAADENARVIAGGQTLADVIAHLTVPTTLGAAAWRARWPGEDGNVLVDTQVLRSKNLAFFVRMRAESSGGPIAEFGDFQKVC